MYFKQDDNDPFYDRIECADIPGDLRQYYRQFKPGYWAYVCPICHYVFPPNLAGMPGGFVTHVKNENGCFFRPGRSQKKSNAAQDF
jgi:hypothetical protein